MTVRIALLKSLSLGVYVCAIFFLKIDWVYYYIALQLIIFIADVFHVNTVQDTKKWIGIISRELDELRRKVDPQINVGMKL